MGVFHNLNSSTHSVLNKLIECLNKYTFALFIWSWNIRLHTNSLTKTNLLPATPCATFVELLNFGLPICGGRFYSYIFNLHIYEFPFSLHHHFLSTASRLLFFFVPTLSHLGFTVGFYVSNISTTETFRFLKWADFT